MSVPTRVLENGQWVTRHRDVWEILARNRSQQEETEDAHRVSISSKAPALAILTRTLLKSPVLKWIIPGQIRHSTRNDVIFVGQDYIRINEAHNDCVLEYVAIKDDFDSTIKSAKILGMPKQSGLDTIFRHNRRDAQGVSGLENQGPDSDTEMPDVRAASDESHRSSLDSSSITGIPTSKSRTLPREFPPQILSLVLESGKIVFVYAVTGPKKTPFLVSTHMELPSFSSPAEELGEHMAVDPRSRALAVGSHERRFIIYSLKSWERMEEEFKENEQILPVQSVRLEPETPVSSAYHADSTQFRSLVVDGTILKMDFLYPAKNDEDHVLLLLVINKDQRSRLVWYEWDTKTSLSEAPMNPSYLTLDSKCRLPLLLIPLTIAHSFLLVCETRTVAYRDLLSGQPGTWDDETLHKQGSEDVATSKNPPMWVQWARPPRSRHDLGDSIYVCREDGIVYYFQIRTTDKGLFFINHHAGNLQVKIDSSFAVIDLGRFVDDFLIAGGDCSDGGHWMFSPRHDVQCLAMRPNWTPIVDSLIYPPAKVPSSVNASEALPVDATPSFQPRLLACTSRTKHGSITELRHGIKASESQAVVELDMDPGTVLGIWSFSSKDVLYVLLSHFSGSMLIRLQSSQDPESLEWENQEARTIEAVSTGRGCLVQFTTSTISEISLSAGDAPVIHWTHSFGDTGTGIVVGHALRGNGACQIIVGLEQQGSYVLRAGHALSTYHPSDASMFLKARPTCLSTSSLDSNVTLVAVGLATGDLEVYLFKGESFQHVSSYQFNNSFEICDSVTIHKIGTTSHPMLRLVLVCGLRDGSLSILRFEDQPGPLQLQHQLAVGHTSVKVSHSGTSMRDVAVHCEGKVYLLRLEGSTPREVLGLLLEIHPELAEEGSQLQDSRLSLCAVTHPLLITSHPLPAQFAAFVAGSLWFLKLDRSFGNVTPHRIPLRISPTRFFFSQVLNSLVVLSLEVQIVRNPQNRSTRHRAGKRALRPIVSFVDISNQNLSGPYDTDFSAEAERRSSPLETYRFTLDQKPGERFLGICEWTPHCDGLVYHLFVINTIIYDRERPASGRLLIYTHKRHDLEQGRRSELVYRKADDMPEPVYCVTPYTGMNNALLYCCGNDLILSTVDRTRWSSPNYQTARWHSTTKIRMRSPGKHMTVQAPYIYVSGNFSLQVFHYDHEKKILSSCYGDSVARPGIHHINLSGIRTVLAADLAGSVVGLWQPESHRADRKMVTIFEASLPRAMTRILPIQFPAAMQDVYIPAGPIILADRAASYIERVQSDSTSTKRTISEIHDSRPNAIIGTSTDGTLTQLTVLGDSWRLLKFIQNMCERDSALCPVRMPSKSTLGGVRDGIMARPNPRHLEPRTDNPRFMHVDGDILQRLLEPSVKHANTSDPAHGLLMQMLNRPLPKADTRLEFADFESVQARWRRFGELAADVLGDEFVQECGISRSESDTDEDENNGLVGRNVLVAEVLRWMRYVMRSAL